MNWVDLIIIGFVLIFALEGQKRGFLVQIIDLLGLLIALISAFTFYPQSAKILIQYFNLPQIAANPVGFLFVWLITEVIFFTFFSGLIGRIFSLPQAQKINRLFGFLPAAASAFLILAFLILFVVSLPINPNIKQDIFESKLGSTLVEKATTLERPFSEIFGPITRRGLTFFTVTEDQKSCQSLGFTQAQTSADKISEREMLELVNRERAKIGSQPLIWRDDLAVVARNHSEDMMKRNYFCHFSPEGTDVGDRLDSQAVRYSFAGENLAYAPDVKRAHNGLMNSPGHRRNILDPAFSKIGIGVVDGGIYGKMFTQVFTN